MTAKTLMVQGTASSVGKSLLVAALCRILKQDGHRVAPFKSQNMALNSYATLDGREMGRAQVVQAEAAGLEPQVEMNPILLKPEGNSRSQVVVMGRPIGSLTAREYYQRKAELWPVVERAFAILRESYEIVLIEGAGSPAEINLRDSDIVNMKVARLAGAPVVLVGDIDRGGVFASLVGTMELLLPEEREMVRGTVINKFRGDVSLLTPGLEFLASRTGVPVLGVVPYLQDLRVAEEDSVALERRRNGAGQGADEMDIAVVRLPHISNFDDFDPLDHSDAVRVRYVHDAAELGVPDLIILPGTKSTVEDLLHITKKGLVSRIRGAAAAGTPVIGVCGGYQMLGRVLRDPDHVESSYDEVPGIGLLPVETTFLPEKTTRQVTAVVAGRSGMLAGAAGCQVAGYEIHCGASVTYDAPPAFQITNRAGLPAMARGEPDGAINGEGTVIGTYIHGLFHNPDLLSSLISYLAGRKGVQITLRQTAREDEYDRLAATVRASLDMPKLYEIIGL